MAVRVDEMCWINFSYLRCHLLEVRPPGSYRFSKEISHKQEVRPCFVSMSEEISVKMVLLLVWYWFGTGFKSQVKMLHNL